MIFEEKGDKLVVFIKGDLNYLNSLELSKKAKDKKEIEIVFECSKFIDSEGIKTLFILKKEGKKVRLKNVPDLFFKAVKILSLDELLECVEG